MVVENVRGAQKWVGRSRWHYGSFHLWGDVPALMPMVVKESSKVPGFRFDGSGKSFQSASVEATGVKRAGMNWSGSDKPGYTAVAFKDTSHIKNTGGSWFDVEGGKRNKGRNDPRDSVKQPGDWFGDTQGISSHSSKSSKRKFASAMIAKIPLALSTHIARTYYPR
jgi:hypothetical protein